MLRLPPPLLRRLSQVFPSVADRERFVADTLDRAIAEFENMPAIDDTPAAVGGTLHLFCDGGSRGNPGQAAIAAILEDPVRGVVLDQTMERIGVETNNVAEYKALIAGLTMAERYHPNRLICHLDSELVVRQVNGQYQVKMATLKPFLDDIRRLSAAFADVVFVHIPRKDNHRADALVNRALDEMKEPRNDSRPLHSPSLFPDHDTHRYTRAP